MTGQQIIDLARLRLETARDLNEGRISYEQWTQVHNVTALVMGDPMPVRGTLTVVEGMPTDRDGEILITGPLPSPES